MRLVRLHLLAYGPFTGRVVDFGADASLILIHGANEAGKSTLLKAITDLRFGFEQQSDAGFLHANSALRIGGEFLDAEGNRHAVIRRKGRGNTLMQADFTADEPMLESAAPADVEPQLHQGFDRQEWMRTFGLDRDRVVQGGRDLFAADGDIGTLLFEASSGGASIQDVSKQLKNNAKHLYVAGGKNGLINRALARHKDHTRQFRSSETIPIVWKRLQRAHEESAAALNDFLSEERDVNSALFELRELRAVVAPLAKLEQDRTTLAALDDIPLLPPSIDADLRELQAAKTIAERQRTTAEDAIAGLTATIDTFTIDRQVLDHKHSIGKLVAAVDNLEQRRSELKLASLDVRTTSDERARVAAAIDSTVALDNLLNRVPTRSVQAEYNRTLQQAAVATSALNDHRQSADKNDPEAEPVTSEQADSDAIERFREVLREIDSHERERQQLRTLPLDQQKAQRTLQRCLSDIDLTDAKQLMGVKPLPDARLDTEVELLQHSRAKRQKLTEQSESIIEELRREKSRHQMLLDAGIVATIDDVQAGRSARDAHWQTLRLQCIDKPGWLHAQPLDLLSDQTDEQLPDPASRQLLAEEMERLTTRADDLADTLASDTRRATELQQCVRRLQQLEQDRQEFELALQRLTTVEEDARKNWQNSLTRASLPHLSPAELREWQTRLIESRQAAEALQSQDDELATLHAWADDLLGRLREAVVALGESVPVARSSLDSLVGLARQLEAGLQEQAARRSEEKGQQAERQRTRQRHQEREQALHDKANHALAASGPVLEALLLPANTVVDVALARLDEFIELAECDKACRDATTREAGIKTAIDSLSSQMQTVRKALDDADELDPLIYAEQVSRRLLDAQQADTNQQIQKSRLAETTAALQSAGRDAQQARDQLASLCEQAGVATVNDLPERLDAARLKRKLQDDIESAVDQLARSSTLSEADLRRRLGARNVLELDNEMQTLTERQASLQEQISVARQQEEATRREFESKDSSADAALAAEGLQQEVSTISNHLGDWARIVVADALLGEATLRFRQRAQAPMFNNASRYFNQLTDGEFTALDSEETARPGEPRLVVTRRDRHKVSVDGLSEGTRDQLYLSLRLAAIELRRQSGVDLPVILDDVLMSSDEGRSALALGTLADFSRTGQVLILTHHRHIVELARQQLDSGRVTVIEL